MGTCERAGYQHYHEEQRELRLYRKSVYEWEAEIEDVWMHWEERKEEKEGSEALFYVRRGYHVA